MKGTLRERERERDHACVVGCERLGEVEAERGRERETEPNVCEQSQQVVNKVTFPSMRLKTNFHQGPVS